MPEIDGLSLLKIVKECYPQTVRMVLSGYTQLSQVLATINRGEIFQFVPKPWQLEGELLVAIRQGIERYNLGVARERAREELLQQNLMYSQSCSEMEQKLINEKKDLTSLKHVNHWMFAFWKKHLEMVTGTSPEIIKDAFKHVDLIEEILLMYMDILPTVFAGRDIEQIVAGITNSCNGRVEFQNQKQNISLVLNGYYDFLEMVFKLLVYLQSNDASPIVSLTMTVEPKDAEGYKVIFNCILPKNVAIDQTRLKIGYSMLDEIGRAYSVRLLPQTGAAGVESVRVVWQAVLPNCETQEK